METKIHRRLRSSTGSHFVTNDVLIMYFSYSKDTQVGASKPGRQGEGFDGEGTIELPQHATYTAHDRT